MHKEQKDLGADAAAVETAEQVASDPAPHVAPLHTPGPWCVSDGLGSGYIEVVVDDDQPGLLVVARIDERDEEDEEYANAYLIAAAPEMKEALTQIQSQCAGHADEFSRNVCQIAAVALAKAEGKV